jgi:hypothetical protein
MPKTGSQAAVLSSTFCFGPARIFMFAAWVFKGTQLRIAELLGIHVLSDSQQERRGWPGQKPGMTNKSVN